jgi:hypothetical protein
MDDQEFINSENEDEEPVINRMNRPDDFTFTFEYREGSVPPQFYHEYSIEVTRDGSGEIHYLPDFPQNHPEEFIELFKVSSTDMDRLYLVMKHSGLLHPTWQPSRTGKLGGPKTRLQVIAGGRVFEIRQALDPDDADGLDKMYDMIRASVPERIWEKIGQLRA